MSDSVRDQLHKVIQASTQVKWRHWNVQKKLQQFNSISVKTNQESYICTQNLVL